MAAKIERAIRQNAGLIAAQILEGEVAGADEASGGEDLPSDDAGDDGTVTSIAGGGRRGKRGG
jgi:recombination protein RecA